MLRIFLISVTIIIVLVAGYFVYLEVTYIDNKVIAGKAYGFKIGDTKEETYHRTKKAFNSKDVFILFPLDKDGYGPHKKFHSSGKEYAILRKREKWEFFFDEGFFNFIRLDFKNNKLTTIYRHRQKFELP